MIVTGWEIDWSKKWRFRLRVLGREEEGYDLEVEVKTKNVSSSTMVPGAKVKQRSESVVDRCDTFRVLAYKS